MRHSGRFVLQLAGSPPSRCCHYLLTLLARQEVGRLAAGPFCFSCRTRQYLGAHSFLDGPSLGEHCASDLLYTIFLGLFSTATVAAWSKSAVFGVVIAVLPATIPIAFIGLHIFVAIIQATFFTVLPSVYLGMATADEH